MATMPTVNACSTGYAAKLLGITQRTASNWAAAGRLPVIGAVQNRNSAALLLDKAGVERVAELHAEADRIGAGLL